jgi:3-oxoacyl-[acyl-carrier-protein] synthase II
MVAYASMRERALITGIGCVSSFGIGRAAFVDALMSGACGIAPITDFDTSSCRSHLAATIRSFDPGAYVPPLKLRRIDAVGRLALACMHLLFDDAHLAIGSAGSDDIGVALGTFTAGLDSIVEYLKGLTRDGPMGVPALIFSNTVSNAPASLCAIEFGLRGPNVTFNQREASSLAALAYAVGLIRDDHVGAMVTGGVDRLEETFFRVYDRFRALSPMRAGTADADSAREEAARPFDRRHNGFVLGEGGFSLLLESPAVAERRGAHVYGEILGLGVSASSTPLNRWPADGSGLTRAMQLALADASLAADRIDAVFATGNGSPQLDRLEASAMAQVFGDRTVPVASLKGAIGESAASGAAAIVAGLALVTHGVVPPTCGFAIADPECRVHVCRSRQPVAGDTFVVNSVASGGTNCSVVVRAAPGT